MSTANVDAVIEWMNQQVEREANEYVADNIVDAMDYAIWDTPPAAPMSDLYQAIADVTIDNVAPVEIVYTADVFAIYDQNTNECDDALESTYGDLSSFATISDAISAAVHQWLHDELTAALDRVTDAARDLAEEHKDAEDAEDED